MRKNKDFINAFSEYTSNHPASPKFLKWSAISAISGALERKTWVKYNSAYCYPNQLIFLIGPAGLGKKTSSSGEAMDILKRIVGE